MLAPVLAPGAGPVLAPGGGGCRLAQTLAPTCVRACLPACPPPAPLQVRPETPALDAMVLMEEKNIRWA